MRKAIALFNGETNEVIARYDISNICGDIMDYYYYYFDGYENYIKYLLSRGAIEIADEDKTYDLKLIPIYEIK